MIEPNHERVKLHLDFLRDHINHTDCPCVAHGAHALHDLYECLRRSQMKLDADSLGRFLVEAIELLRWYRSRIHRVDQDEDGGFSPYHTVYGVHRDGMAAADELLNRAAAWGMLGRQREFHG